MVSISQRRTPLPWYLALVAIVALFVARAAAQRAPIEPEAQLSLAYAKSLAEGHGLVLLPHAERVEGPQSLLFTLLLALAHAVGLHGASAASSLSLTSAALALAVIALVPAALYDRRPRFFDLAASAVAGLVPTFVAAAASGEEHTLVAALSATVVLSLAREERDAERYPWSSLALVALFLARPSALFVIVAVGACKLARDARPSRPRRQDVLWVVSIAAGLFAITLFRLAYFAALLPAATLAPDWTARAWLDGRRSALELGLACLRGERLFALAALSLASLVGSRPHSARVAIIAIAVVSLLSVSAVDRAARAPSFALATVALLLSLASAEGARNVALTLARFTPRTARSTLSWLATPACFAALAYLGPLRFAARPPIAVRSTPAPIAASRLARLGRELAIDAPITVAACARSLALDEPLVRLRDLSGRADSTFARRAIAGERALFAPRTPALIVLDGTCPEAAWLRASDEQRAMFVALEPEALSSVRVNRAAIAAPFGVGATRHGANSGVAASTLSHGHATPGATVAVELLLTRDALGERSSVRLVDAQGRVVSERPCGPSELVSAQWLFNGERPRARVLLRAASSGTFAIEWRSPERSLTVGSLSVAQGGDERDIDERRARVRRSISDERYDLGWGIARSLALRAAIDARSEGAREVLAEFARSLAERAKVTADARAWMIAADIAESAATLAPEDRRTLSLCSEVAERLADAASEAEDARRFEAAFLLAERAVQIDPRRSWSRRRAEALRSITEPASPVDRARAYREAASALAASDPSALDRAIVALAATGAWIEAARLAEHAGHTPRDPRARLAAARGLLSQGRAREALALVSGVPCAEASDREVTRALRAIMGARAYRPFDRACRED
jgi:tetratricopeptide (TPR) repeat protein